MRLDAAAEGQRPGECLTLLAEQEAQVKLGSCRSALQLGARPVQLLQTAARHRDIPGETKRAPAIGKQLLPSLERLGSAALPGRLEEAPLSPQMGVGSLGSAS